MTTSLPSTPVALGQVLSGKYRVDEFFGRRGTGLVVRAEHLALGQPVAIKLLQASLTAEHVERFFREARAAAAIGHRNIIDVLDVGRLLFNYVLLDPYM